MIGRTLALLLVVAACGGGPAPADQPRPVDPPAAPEGPVTRVSVAEPAYEERRNLQWGALRQGRGTC